MVPSNITEICNQLNINVTTIANGTACSCEDNSTLIKGLIGAIAASAVLNIALIISTSILSVVLARRKPTIVEDTSKGIPNVPLLQPHVAVHTISYGAGRDYETPIRTVPQYGLNDGDYEYVIPPVPINHPTTI